MDQTKKERHLRRTHWVILAGVIVVVLVTIAYMNIESLLVQHISTNTVRISKAERQIEFTWTWADAYVEGEWREIHYYAFHFYIDIKNDRSIEAPDLKLVVDLVVNNRTVASDTRTIGTLKAGDSRSIEVHFMAVPHIYLYDKIGNSRDMKNLIILYSGNEVLDQRTITQ